MPAASRASWLRWAALRVSPWMAACEGVPLTQGSVVGGVAHAGCGQFREDRVEGGAGLGGQVAADRAHAVEVLVADGEAAASGAVDVGEVAVGVEAVGELVGQLGAVRRGGARRPGGPAALRPGRGSRCRRSPGSRCTEAADHRDMAGTEVAVALRFGGRRQHRRQRFAVERPPLAQVGGFVDAPRCFGAGDPQPVGQRRRPVCRPTRSASACSASWLISGCSTAGASGASAPTAATPAAARGWSAHQTSGPGRACSRLRARRGPRRSLPDY